MNIRFKELQASCKYQGWIKKGGIKMCAYKDKIPAKCWDDWQECKEANCPLKAQRILNGFTGQICLDEFWLKGAKHG